MEAVGRMAGGIAHDFSNVLTTVTASCERLGDDIAEDAPARREIDRILRNAERAAAMVRQLLAFSRQQTLAPRSIDLGRLVGQAGELIQQFIGEHIHLHIEVAPDRRPVEADPGQIEQVMMNLAINARDAMPEGGEFHVSVRNVVLDEQFAREHPPQPPGEYVLLRVSDTGHGMEPYVRERAFEPFFTTKSASHGSGLGLSTVYGIVKQSGGYIWLASEPGRGATFEIYLPPTTTPPAEIEPPRLSARSPSRSKTVLLAEDEDDIRELLSEMLTAHGYDVLAANCPADAMVRAAEHPDTIDLLLTDVVMPGGTGRDLARRLTAIHPHMRVLFMSGYPEHGAAPGSVLEPGSPFLAKPFTRDVLLQELQRLLAS
jgi:CheY-like chemotaxis protein